MTAGILVFTVLTAALPAVSAAQNPAAPLLVSGRVVDDQSGAPLPNARVTTNVTVVGAPLVLTEPDGRFSLRIPPGLHDLKVSKTGYARQVAAVPAGGGVVEVRLARGAAISGRVTDQLGSPAIGFRIRLETTRPDGTRAIVAELSTNDRGEYRAGGLVADAYVVSFIPTVVSLSVLRAPDGRVTQTGIGDAGMMEPFFYPGVTSAEEARPIALRAGEERSDVDFLLPSSDRVSDLAVQQRVLMSPSALVMSDTGFSFVPLSPAEQRGPSGLPVQRTAIVRGRVLDRDGHPLVGARVRLLDGGPSPMVATAKDGRYEFRELTAGTVRVAASKIGYFANTPEYGGRTRSAPAIALKDGEIRDDVEIRLDRWAALEGRVTDERGDPMDGAVVQLLQIKYEAGRRSLVRVDISDPRTDDLGRFRMYGVPAGRFIVSAAVNDVSTAGLPGYARVYYPGTPDASAALFVPVTAGAELGGIEIELARARTLRVAGNVLDARGRPTAAVSLLLYPRGTAYGEPAGARIERDGTFEFLNVPPGQYVIQAGFGNGDPAAGGGFAALAVAVTDADIAGLIVQPSPSSRIAGRILFDTAARGRLPAPNGIRLSAYPLDPLMLPLNRVPRATVNSDWTFEMSGVTGTGRLHLANLPPGWALESIRVNGVDVTDRPLVFDGPDRSLRDVEVTLTDRIATLTGTVVDDRSRALGGVPVIAYAIDAAAWYPSSRFFQVGVTNENGMFSIKGLPSGTYNVSAVSRLPPEGNDAWQDPAYLDGLAPRATTVSITEGLPTTVQPLHVVSR